MRKGFLFVLSVVLCFSFLSVASAENDQIPTRIEVRDIIPQEYYDLYKGKYSSFEEVYKAFGMITREMTPDESMESDGFNINTPDELAAFVAYTRDNIKTNETGDLPQIDSPEDNELLAPFSTSSTKTEDVHLYEDALGLFWIKGYTTVDYVTNTGHITLTTSRTALLGLTVGRTWRPDDPRITVLSARERRVLFAGELDHNIFIGGIGTFWTENVSGSQYINSCVYCS